MGIAMFADKEEADSFSKSTGFNFETKIKPKNSEEELTFKNFVKPTKVDGGNAKDDPSRSKQDIPPPPVVQVKFPVHRLYGDYDDEFFRALDKSYTHSYEFNGFVVAEFTTAPLHLLLAPTNLLTDGNKTISFAWKSSIVCNKCSAVGHKAACCPFNVNQIKDYKRKIEKKSVYVQQVKNWNKSNQNEKENKKLKNENVNNNSNSQNPSDSIENANITSSVKNNSFPEKERKKEELNSSNSESSNTSPIEENSSPHEGRKKKEMEKNEVKLQKQKMEKTLQI
jgi:hypothetical protein